MARPAGLLRSASFTALIGFADRDTFVSLSLVVKLTFVSSNPLGRFTNKKTSFMEAFLLARPAGFELTTF